MATAQISLDTSAEGVIRDKVYAEVWVKEKWADDWQPASYITPVKLNDVAAPTVGSAELLFHYGEIKREGGSAFAVESPRDLAGWYVQINLVSADGTFTLWHGIVPETVYGMHGAASAVGDPSGDQVFRAYGLEHALDQCRVTGAHAYSGAESIQIGYTPRFNERARRGGRIHGNRSWSRNADDVYEFEHNGAEWNHRDIAEYVLKYHGPAGITFELGGQTDLIENIVTVQDFAGARVRDVLNELIPRYRGVGWCIRTSGASTVTVHVFSLFGADVSVGDATIPGNGEPSAIDISTDPTVLSAELRDSEVARFDRVRVQGARIKSCWSPEYYRGTLEKAWGSADETAYRAADPGGTDDPLLNDAERRQDKYARVYVKHRAPSNFVAAMGGTAAARIFPRATDDGGVDTSQVQEFFPANRVFLRHLPFYENNPGGSSVEPELQRPFAWIQDDGGTYKWYQTDAVPEDFVQASVRMCDTELAVEVKPFGANHAYGKNHFTPATDKKSSIDPVFDYECMGVTVFMETDEHLHVVADVGDVSALDVIRTLHIDVPDAEYWIVAPNTVSEVRDGKLIRSAGGQVRRDDGERLRKIAALAKAWYGRTRGVLSITWQRLGAYTPPGCYITTLQSGAIERQVGTVVSARSWDFANGTTSIQTDYGELDVSAFIGGVTRDRPGVPIERQVAKVRAEVQEIEDHLGNLPVRWPQPPGGGSNLFDDGLGLSSAAPNTNQYHAAPTWQDVKAGHWYGGASWSKWKAVLRFAKPLNTFQAWSAVAAARAAINTSDVDTVIGINSYLDATFKYYLVTESLEDLTQFTWNNPPSVAASGVQLTRFDLDLEQGGVVDEFSNPYTPGDSADFRFAAMRVGDSQTKASSGPYYGLLIEIDEDDIMAFSDPMMNLSSAEASLTFENTRATQAALARGRVLK